MPSLGAVVDALDRAVSTGAVRAVADAAPTGAAAPGDGARGSAVLIVLFEEDGEVHVVLTRRSAELRSHTGQVSFPGGRIEEGEAPVAAALREAHEEVGLDPGSVRVLGCLPPTTTMLSSAPIQPVVGVVDGGRPHLVASPAEVARVFDVPLVAFGAPGVAQDEDWGDGRRMRTFVVAGERVWGATARMLAQLLEVVVGVTGAGGEAVT